MVADPGADPEGDFMEAIGRQHTAEEAAGMIAKHMADWKGKFVQEQRYQLSA